MKCSKIGRLLPGYIDCELAAALDAEVRGHVSGCAGCGLEEEQLRSSMELLDAWTGFAPRLGYDALAARIASGATARTKQAQMPGVPSWAIGALAIVGIAAGVILGVTSPGALPRPVPTEQQVASAMDLHSFDDVFESYMVRELTGGKAVEEQR